MKTEHTSLRMLRAELSLNSCTGEVWEMTARGRAVGGEMINCWEAGRGEDGVKKRSYGS